PQRSRVDQGYRGVAHRRLALIASRDASRPITLGVWVVPWVTFLQDPRTMTMRALLLCLLAACGVNKGDDGVIETMHNCVVDTRGEAYVPGLDHPEASADFKLVSSNPAPPSRGDNTWVLQINA